MIIIAICFDEQATCSCHASPMSVDTKDYPRACLEYICKARNLPEESVDEILLVADNHIIQYTAGMWGNV